MDQTQQKLTELINTINQSFPDENDLKGFQGISKILITDALKQSDATLTNLRAFDGHFETIFLKRELFELFEKLKGELEDKFDKIKSQQFNAILKNVSKINTRIKEVYVAVVNTQPIRTEAEIIKAKEELGLLNSNIEELKKINTDIIANKDVVLQTISAMQTEVTNSKKSAVTGIAAIQEEAKVAKDAAVAQFTIVQSEITILKDTTVQNITTITGAVTTMKDTAAKIVADFEAKQKTSSEHELKITEFLGKIEAHKTTIETIDKNTTLWEAEIKKAKEDIATNLTQYEGLSSKSKNLNTEIEQAHEKIIGKKDADGKTIKGYLQETEDLKTQISEFLAEQYKKFQAQFTQIESLLPGATSLGLAQAYENQKKSYDNPIKLWSRVFISTVSIMAVLSIILICFQYTSTLTLSEALISFIKDIPFFIPTIWLAVYASKQQSQNKRLQQEYAFKETNAKSFYGHKKQIEELMQSGGATDKQLLSQLMAQLVLITSINPSETLDNKSHNDSPPIFKLVEKIFPSAKKAVSTNGTE